MNFEPYFKSDHKNRSTDHLKDLYFENQNIANAIGAILNSTMFYIWFTVQGNCRNIAGPDIQSFPVGTLNDCELKELNSIFSGLMASYNEHSKIRVYNYKTSGKVEYQEFYPNLSKHVLDKIDRVLAGHFDLLDGEIDAVINYDIKYRLGALADDES